MTDEPLPPEKPGPARQKCHVTHDATSIPRQENYRFSSRIIQVQMPPPFDFRLKLKTHSHAVENGSFLTLCIGADVKACDTR
jgi:hypothetical protein